MVLDLKVEAGELRRGAEFTRTSKGRVAERYSGKTCGDIALCVGGPKYILEIDESSGSQNSLAEFDGPYRKWLIARLLLLIRGLVVDVGSATVDFRRRLWRIRVSWCGSGPHDFGSGYEC